MPYPKLLSRCTCLLAPVLVYLTASAQCYTPAHLSQLRDEVIVEHCGTTGHYSLIVTTLSNRWFIGVRDPQVIADLLEGYEATRHLPYPQRTAEEYRWIRVLLTPTQQYFLEEYYRQLEVHRLQEARRNEQLLHPAFRTAATTRGKAGGTRRHNPADQHYVDSTLDVMIYEHHGAHRHLSSLIALAYSRRKELQLYDPRQLARMAHIYNRLKSHPNRWQQEWDALYDLLDPSQRDIFYRIVKELERKTREKEAAKRMEAGLDR